mgnify:CR=1 FL=1
MAKHLPPFFRYTFAVNGYIWKHKSKLSISVSGRYFCFHHTDRLRKELVKNEVKTYVWKNYISKGGNPRIMEGEEDERVSQDETVGLGFYRGEVLDKGRRIFTFDLRFGRERI